MILKQTTDIDEIKAILCDPAIYDTITDDNCMNSSEFEPPLEGYRYIGGYVGDNIIALMVYHEYLDGSKCHVQVLPEFRKEYAKQFGEQSLMFNGTRPLYAEIPELYNNVLEFAKINGFKVIDTKLNDSTKHGITYNTKVLSWDLSEI